MDNKNEAVELDGKLSWDDGVEKSFERLISKIPVFMRGIAEKKVLKKIESVVADEGRAAVCEKDLVDAFFSETPFGFHGLMKNDMEEFDIDYMKYGHSK